jgi:hypothetical protein
MAVYNQNQLISASNATYTTNGANEITAADVRNLNNSWVSSSALISGSNTFYNDQIISGSLNVIGDITGSLFGTATSASHAVTASFALSGGSGGSGFPFNGDAVITGSLTISGSNNYPLNLKGLYIGSGNGTNSNNIVIGGTSLASNTTGTDNIAIGRNITLFSNTTGYSNIAIGGSALVSNTTGFYNISIGNESLRNNSVGIGNFAVGLNALRNNTSGGTNIALGIQSLENNTIGNSNIALGDNNLRAIASGDYNTAIGYQAGTNASGSSSNNVYLGANSGPSNPIQESNKLYIHNISGTPLIGGDFAARTVAISGSMSITGSLTISGSNGNLLNVNGVYLGTGDGNLNNISIGSNLNLDNNTSGVQNIAIGNSSLRYNISGNDNMAIGNNALLVNLTGDQNTAIGTNAISRITSGSKNTAIGLNAGTNAVSGSTANVYIGWQAGPGSATTEANKLYINNDQGTPLIGGDFLTGTVTIDDILVLNPRTTNPSSPASGSLIVSGSGADIKPYFWNGSTWTSLI